MADEISIRANGSAEMAYTGAVGWHGLGNHLAAGAAIEEWIAAAGFDWSILRSRVRYAVDGISADDPASWASVDDRVVLFRSDTAAPLGVVSDDYQVVQPLEVMEFFRELTERMGMTMETAGCLFGGRRFWALAATGESAAIADPADRLKGYILLSTSADGSLATEARYTTVRVVCHNTLSLARGKDKASVRVAHRSVFDPAAAKSGLGLLTEGSRFDDAMNDFRRMAETKIEDAEVINHTGRIFVPGWSDMSPAERAANIKRATSPVQAVARLALDGTAQGAGLAGTDGTVWGWLNAVTEYVDHSARAKNQDNRLNSAFFGTGAAIKTAAYESAIAMADGSYKYVPAHRARAEIVPDADILGSVLAATAA
jgi:phage/plasmid-like protein (TIGR03299 family)